MTDAQRKPAPWQNSYPVDIDWNADIPQTTMVKMFDETVKKNARRTALNFMGKKMTYAELGKAADRFAKGLQQQGIGKGSKVGLCLPNTPFYAIAYYGAMKAGATVVNFNPLYAEKEIEHQINDSQTDLMVTVNVKQVQSKVEKMLGKTSLKKIVSCDLADALPTVKGTAFRVLNAVKGLAGKSDTMKTKKDASHARFGDMLKNDGKFTPVPTTPEDVAVLQYTGGTTGVPKAAMLTHGNLTANVEQAGMWFNAGKLPDPEKKEKMLAVLPFFHVFSMTVQLNLTLKMGAELVMMPKFELKELLKTIDKQKPTIFAGVPTIYKAMADAPDVKKYDLSSLELCVSGGAPLPEGIKNDFHKLTGLELVEGYGLSESSPIAIANPVNGVKKTNSIGLPVPRTEVKIVDLKVPDKEQPLKVEGEICLRGPQVMKGYWNRPDETEKVLDKQGFLHTGDVGYMDDDGYVFIVDRIKDMIIASGLKVFPRKVEEAIMEHPKVSEVMVAGVQDPYRGETVKAWMVPKLGETLDAAEMKTFLKSRLAPYEMPKMMEFRDSLPKTMIGKPDRKALLAEEAAKQAAKKPAAPKGPSM
ncbi:MAG: long-chain fatty acid--CoA ligase [Alphaproteobacteria bacterium]|nr:long-chain fatty acid--CoA ligase [Alphaproteobacteria bacterium]